MSRNLMKSAVPPLSGRAESMRLPASEEIVASAEKNGPVCHVWLVGAKERAPIELLLRECERISPLAHRFDVHAVADVAQMRAVEGESVCLVWTNAREALPILETARALLDSAPVLVVLREEEEEGAITTRQILEAGASDCLREGELSAALLERSLRYASQSAGRDAQLRRLGEENARLGEAVESASIGMQMCGTIEEGCPIFWVNPAFERLTGYSLEEVAGRHPGSFLEGVGTDPETIAAIERGLRAEKAFQTTVLNFRRDGTPFWNEIHLSPVRENATGRVSGWIGHLIDVTARVEARQHLEQSRRDLEVAQRLTHLGSWWVALEGSGDLANAPGFWSDELYRIVGLPLQSVPLRFEVWQSLVPAPDFALVMAQLSSLLSPGGPPKVSFEHRLVMSDGSEKWVQSRAELEHDPSGTPVRLVGTVLDVSERVQDAGRIRESEQRMRAVVENAPLVLWQLDERGIITSIQGRALGFIGRTPADLQGHSIFEVLEGVPALQNLARRALDGEECEDEAWFGDRFFAVRYAPSGKGGALGVGVDMTDTEGVRQQWRESERRYASMVANVPGVVYRFLREADGTLRFDFISARAREVWGDNFGRDHSDLLLHIERIHPDDWNELFTSINDSAHNLTPWDWSGRLLDTGGQWKWVRATAIPWQRDDEAIVWDGIVVDETATRTSQAELERSRGALEDAQQLARVGSFDFDVENGQVEWSDTMFRLFGYEPKSFTPEVHSILQHVHESDLELVKGAAHRALENGGDSMLFRIRRADGEERFLQAHAHSEVDEDGNLQRFVGATQDVTEQILAQRALRESEERYALAARGANDGLWDWNLRTNAIYFSPRWLDMIGCALELSEGAPHEWLSRVHPDDRAALDATLEAHLSGQTSHFESEYRLRHDSGEWKWMLGRGLAVRDGSGQATRIAGSQTDISARKHFESQLAHSAFYDALTGLPNRALFIDRLERAIARSARDENHSFAVLFLDLDRFKNINDSLGHLAGDILLIEAGRRFESCLRPGDTVARLGGDEFAVLLEGLADESAIETIATRVGRELELPIQLEGHDVFITVSIGVAPAQGGETRAVELLRNADTAMYRAKGLGRARHATFDTSMHQRAVRLLELESDLWRALERHELRVYFQPIICLETGLIHAVEALVRWQHPLRGLVSPGEFIPLAEETGLIVPMGWWVLEEACRCAAGWSSELMLTVNLSSQQFSQPDILERVKSAIELTGFDPTRLKLEITESVIMGNTESANAMLSGLREMGVNLAMDDFGTGYSSLSYLHRFPIDTLKIDRSFVAQLSAGSRNDQIVRTILSLAHGLELIVVAEGIESEEQLQALRAMGCDAAQGFYFARPLPPDILGELLAQNPRW